jgi:pimeloyl-ACP methyl ester carboxylesterase
MALVALTAASGCSTSSRQPFVSAARLERGLVVVLTGIEGRSSFNEAICRGLSDGGVNYAIELTDWTSPWGPLANLRAQERNRRQAALVADRIIDYLYDYPGRPVYVVGQSGGGAMAAWTAECLPSGYHIDGIIMLDASLSPGYALDTAIRRSNQGIVSFYSQRDIVLLGLGTTIAGTMDGQHSSSAGRDGFVVPTTPARMLLYRKLYQIAWQPRMAETGHHGLHITSGAEGFVASYVAPFITASRWDEEVVARVLDRDPGATVEGPHRQPPPVIKTPRG